MKGDELARYTIRIDGHVDDQWGDWFDCWSVTVGDDGTTSLTGPPIDQSALHGLLRKVGDLGMTLVSIALADSPPQSEGE